MKLLYGTGNLAKLSAMRNRLEQLDMGILWQGTGMQFVL